MTNTIKNMKTACFALALFTNLSYAGSFVDTQPTKEINSISFSNVKKIIEEIKAFDKKDEFTKQSVIDDKYKTYIGKEFYFKQEDCHNWGSAKYDLNKEVYNIDIPYYTSELFLSMKDNQKSKLYPVINISCSRLTDKTMGMNAFGVQAEITNFYETGFGIFPLNVNPHKKLSFNLKMSPEEAKNLKGNYGFFYKVEVINSIFKDKTAKDFQKSEATIDKPVSLQNILSYLVVNLKEVSIYNTKTNKILMTKTFKP